MEHITGGIFTTRKGLFRILVDKGGRRRHLWKDGNRYAWASEALMTISFGVMPRINFEEWFDRNAQDRSIFFGEPDTVFEEGAGI
jgi:hypothetical protein